jgi:thiosulfate dehydrogenase [quinone] large subunit
MRLLFGVGWLLAGVTKISEKSWFSEPGVFLHHYLTASLVNPNVPDFYSYFIEHVALKYVMFFNYVIPVVQIVLGLFIILGFKIIPSILICLFMHVNFILSGNMNLISLVLYTSAFSLLLNRDPACFLSLDLYFKSKPTRKKEQPMAIL